MTGTARLSVLACLGLAAATSLAAPAPALAHPRAEAGSDRHPDGVHTRRRPDATAVLVVHNPTATAVRVRLGDDITSVVPAGGEVRFGRVSPGVTLLEASFSLAGRTLILERRRVELGPGDTDRLVLPARGPGLARVHNRWVEPVRVVVDGIEQGTLAARDTSLLGPFPAGTHLLTLLGPDGSVYLRRTLDQPSMALGHAALVAEATTVMTLTNRTGRFLRLAYADGTGLGQVGPGTHTLRVASGHQELVATLAGGRSVGRLEALINPFTGTSWTLNAPRNAAVVLVNPHRFAVQVYADGRLLGRLDARESRTFLLDVGPVRLVADRVGRGGPRFATRLDVDPWDGGAWRIDDRVADRDRGVWVTVRVPG